MLVIVLSFTVFVGGVHAQSADGSPGPAVYLNFNEGSGNSALDSSGQGNGGTIYNVTRQQNGMCGQELSFTRSGGYVAIPYRSLNHPAKEITVSSWFYVDNFQPQILISSYHEGGYRIAVDDGGDLWWTVSLEGTGDVSVPVLKESISPHQWHYITGTYDGKTSKVYLDGVLRNQIDASGLIHYQENNYVILGAEGGAYDQPDPSCPHFFHGGLDEVRIYPVALPYGDVMDDRFSCTPAISVPAEDPALAVSSDTCEVNSGSIRLSRDQVIERVLSFANKSVNGTWKVSLEPGSILSISAFDRYSKTYPDAWYLEVSDENKRLGRTIAFPNRNNAPLESILPSGNATVLVRYFDGPERFPAHVVLHFESHPPPPRQEPSISQSLMNNPIIVIYSASWATLIALIVVIVWLHRRRNP